MVPVLRRGRRAGGAGGAREMQVSTGNIWNQPGKLPEACRKNARVLVEFVFILFSSLFQDCFRISWAYRTVDLEETFFHEPDGTGEFGQVWINSSVVEEAKANGAVSSSPGADKSTEELQTCWNYAETILVVHGMIMYVHVGYMYKIYQNMLNLYRSWIFGICLAMLETSRDCPKAFGAGESAPLVSWQIDGNCVSLVVNLTRCIINIYDNIW